MKSKILIAVIIFFASTKLQGQIPNAGFENWTVQPGGWEDPDDWNTNNVTGGISVTKTTDSYIGNFALRVINNFPWVEGPLTGYASIVFTDTNLISKISAFVKCDSISGNGGSAVIAVEGYIGSTSQPIGSWETSVIISQYTQVEIPLVPSMVYDSIAIYIMAVGHSDSLGFNPGYVRFQVDGLLKEILSDVNEINANKVIDVFPNPFEHNASLIIRDGRIENATIEIYSSKGEFIQSFKYIKTVNNMIDRKNLPNGIYIFKAFSDLEYIGLGKFIIE